MRSPGLRLDSVTTVFGNASLAQTTENARRWLRHLGRSDLAVVPGASCSLLGQRAQGCVARSWRDGLGGDRVASERHPAGTAGPTAAIHIAASARRHPQALTLLTLDPLTNVCLALALDSALPQHVDHLVVMGATGSARAMPPPGRDQRAGRSGSCGACAWHGLGALHDGGPGRHTTGDP